MADKSYTSYRAYCERIGVQPMNEPQWQMMYGAPSANHVVGLSSAARQSARSIESTMRTPARAIEPTQGVRAKQHQPTTPTIRPTEPTQQADIAQFLSELWPR